LNAYRDPSEDIENAGNITVKMTSKADEKFIEEVSIMSAVCGDQSDSSDSHMDIEHMHISTDPSITPALASDSATTQTAHTGTKNSTSDIEENPTLSTLRVSKVSWSDRTTFPPPADVLIGSDLVYDSKILTLLTQAVDGMLMSGNLIINTLTQTHTASSDMN
jgi:hypothetical protein